MIPGELYWYRATVIRVVDGDTVDLKIDVGFRCTTEQRCRILLIDAPEMHGETKEAALAAKAHLEELLLGPSMAGLLRVRTTKTDSFGRYLADIWRPEQLTAVNSAWVSVSMQMLAAGHAVPKDGK